MGMTCSICRSPEKSAIDRALLEHAQSHRGIARQFHVDDSSLERHMHTCLRDMILESERLRQMVDQQALEDKLLAIEQRIEQVIARAENNGDDRMILMSCRELRAGIDSLAKIAGILDHDRDMELRLLEVQRQLLELQQRQNGHTYEQRDD